MVSLSSLALHRAILILLNVNKVFSDPDNGAAPVPAVDDASLDVQAGKFFSILRPSGCGKSTLLRIIGGLRLAARPHLTNSLTYT